MDTGYKRSMPLLPAVTKALGSGASIEVPSLRYEVRRVVAVLGVAASGDPGTGTLDTWLQTKVGEHWLDVYRFARVEAGTESQCFVGEVRDGGHSCTDEVTSCCSASSELAACHRRLAPKRLLPFSYFWICWKVMPSARPKAVCDKPARLRACRKRWPT